MTHRVIEGKKPWALFRGIANLARNFQYFVEAKRIQVSWKPPVHFKYAAYSNTYCTAAVSGPWLDHRLPVLILNFFFNFLRLLI